MDAAIVAEGGGQRGIYTAGVLDSFLQSGFNPFTFGVGVSAGAQNLLSYFLQQPGYARRAICELTVSKDFYVPYRWIARRDILDLDGYFERTLEDPEFKLPYGNLTDVHQASRLTFVATERDTLEPVYLKPDANTVVDKLKASSAVPLLYKSGVTIDGQILMDGGVGDPLPVVHAYEMGAKRLLVIRTANNDDPLSPWRFQIEKLLRFNALPVSVRRMLESHEQAMADAESFTANPPNDLELIEVRPAENLSSHTFGSRSDALMADYEVGVKDGLFHAKQLQHWQSSSCDQVKHPVNTRRSVGKLSGHR